MTRDEALQHLATDNRYAMMTAGEAVHGLSQAYAVALTSRDLAFLEFHGEDPCHEVARACAAGHVWHGGCGDGDKPRKPHWRALEQEVVPQVVRKN
jgi:hypothetical protein